MIVSLTLLISLFTDTGTDPPSSGEDSLDESEWDNNPTADESGGADSYVALEKSDASSSEASNSQQSPCK